MNDDKYISFLGSYFKVIKKAKFFVDNDLSFRMKKAFSFSYIELNDLPFVVAKYNRKHFSVSEFDYVKSLIEKNSNHYVVFYFDKLTIQNKMSLTNFGLGYIVGGNQFYIPELSILINENYNHIQVKTNSRLSLGAQNILFKILLLNVIEIHQRGLDVLIKEEEYAIYRAIKELENKNILTIEKSLGRRVVMLDDKREIWEKAKPYLKSPIIEERYVDRGSLFSHKIKPVPSGQFALSKKGMIVPNEDIYAIESKQYKEIKENLKPSFEGHNNAAKLQVWKSRITKTDDNEMNPFALYLSLQDDYDERVQKDYEDYISKYWR